MQRTSAIWLTASITGVLAIVGTKGALRINLAADGIKKTNTGDPGGRDR